MVVNGQLRQELSNLFNTHVLGMMFIVKQNKSSNSLHVCLFCPEAIVFGAYELAHLIQ
jgi:hypothetical protein